MPNLYASDELEKVVAMVRPLAKEAGKGETRDAILSHYLTLVREQLHIVLCMSPIGSGFRSRCRVFPALVNCCTIDWFSAWPEVRGRAKGRGEALGVVCACDLGGACSSRLRPCPRPRPRPRPRPCACPRPTPAPLCLPTRHAHAPAPAP